MIPICSNQESFPIIGFASVNGQCQRPRIVGWSSHYVKPLVIDHDHLKPTTEHFGRTNEPSTDKNLIE